MTTQTARRERTRQALLDAVAAELDAGNSTPSMEEIAAAAEVSRATAYRYFDSVQHLIWHLGAERDLEPVETAFADSMSLLDRVLRAEQINNGYLFGDPDGTRAFERAALDRTLRHGDAADTRPARRLRYLDAALAPVADRLDPERLHRLRHSLSLAIGSQCVPALLDTCGLDVDEARRVTRFAVTTLLTGALEGTGIDPTARPDS